MKLENGYITARRWFKLFISLVIVYCSQVYPYYHLHHYHEEGKIRFEISFHPIDVKIDHHSHDHHDESSGHNDNHHHRFEKQLIWLITRTQVSELTQFDDVFITSYDDLIEIEDDDFVKLEEESRIDKPPFITTTICRGPPLNA